MKKNLSFYLPLFVLGLMLMAPKAIGQSTFCIALEGSKLISNEDEPVYLGTFSSNEFSSDSIANDFSHYGNPFSSDSIFNEFGHYGNPFSSYSPWNEFSSKGPIIVDENLNKIGVLSTNEFVSGAVNPIIALSCIIDLSDDRLEPYLKYLPESSSYSSPYNYYVPSTSNICPINSTLNSNNNCTCNSGFKADIESNTCITNNEACQKNYGIYSWGTDEYCYCSDGYEWNSDQTSCIRKQTTTALSCPNNASLHADNLCYCDSGYTWNNNMTSCDAITTNDIDNREEQIFSDVSLNQQNAIAIKYLKNKNIITGNPDGTFKPNNNVNRAELSKLIVSAKEVYPDESTYNNCFPDVKNEWYAPYICYAKSKNWLNGYPDGKFKPEQTVNKAETMKILLKSFDISTDGVGSGYFWDIKTSDWFVSYANKAHELNLIEQTIRFSGENLMTKAKIAESLARLIYIKENNLSSYVNFSLPN